jgi:hypothetical protein
VVLIPKKDNPRVVSDYRPISLTHSFAKIISKLLANRLAPELEKLISINQTTFIKKEVSMITSCMFRRSSRIHIKEKFLLYSSS